MAAACIRPWPARIGVAAVLALLATAIGAHLLLLPLGKWQPDEFIRFHNLQIEGGRAVWALVRSWSQRPFSELLLWIYGSIADEARRPLVAPCLALAWAALLIAIYLAMRQTRRDALLLSLALFASFLLLDKPGEAFYWPAAALAYIPGLAAVAVVCLLPGSGRERPVVSCLALLIAAGSNEIAATFVVIHGALLAAALLLVRPRTWQPSGGRIWLGVLPVAAAMLVIGMTATHRMAHETPFDAASQAVDSIAASVRAAAPQYLAEIAGIRFPRDVLPAVEWGIPIKLGLFLAFRPKPTESAHDATARLHALVRGIALLLAGFVSLVSAYHVLGLACCERHETFRQALTILALYNFAQLWPSRLAASVRPTLLAIALGVAFWWRWPNIGFDQMLIVPTASAEARSWRSGSAPGDAMQWINAPVPQVANGWLLRPGVYEREFAERPGDLDWRVFAVMAFFHKRVMRVR